MAKSYARTYKGPHPGMNILEDPHRCIQEVVINGVSGMQCLCPRGYGLSSSYCLNHARQNSEVAANVSI